MFIFENRLCGLLCDDMGLDKTHQTMESIMKEEEWGYRALFS